MSTALDDGPIRATNEDRQIINRLDILLRITDTTQPLKLLGSDGEVIPLPASVFRALGQLVHHLAQNKVVALVPVDKYLSAQQAADILNYSHSYVLKLLEDGAIPFTRTGAHRRVLLDDLLAYKQRRAGLAQLTQMGQEFGLDDE